MIPPNLRRRRRGCNGQPFRLTLYQCPPCSNHWDGGFRRDVPEFYGNMDPDAFLNWLTAVEEILIFADVPADRGVPLVTIRLRGREAVWRQQLKLLKKRQGKPYISSLEKFIKHLQEEYLPFNYQHTLYQKLQNYR